MGKEVFFPEEELPPLEEGGYYSHHLVGCQVFTVEGENVGVVMDILAVPENDLLIVQRGEEKVLIPFSQPICVDVDTGKKIIVIDPPEGLLD